MVAIAMRAPTVELPTRALKPDFGVEILDLDLPTATEDELQAFDDICRFNAVAVVRNQTLSAREKNTLSERIGKISAQHRVGPHPEFPAITILSN